MELKEIKGQSDALEKDINDEKKKLFPNGETFEDLENQIRQKNLMIQTLKERLAEFEKQLQGANAAVFTHVSNVFGYILPVK